MTMSRRLIHQLLGLLISFVVLAIPAAVAAQESTPTTPDLIVTVRDVRGAPLPGVTVQIRAGVDTPILAQAVSNAQGQAMFATISVSQVRMRVLGTLASGAQLYQIGADAPGVAVFLGPPPTTLDLRVDSDGMVLPDPVTMIDPVPYGPVIVSPAPGPDGNGRIVFPTSATEAARRAPTVAASASTSSMTSTTPASLAPVAPPAEAGAENPVPASTHLLNWGVGIGGAFALLVGGFLLIRSLGRRRP
jgi:hypothetical protein